MCRFWALRPPVSLSVRCERQRCAPLFPCIYPEKHIRKFCLHFSRARTYARVRCFSLFCLHPSPCSGKYLRISALRVTKRVNIHSKLPSPVLLRVLILYKSKRRICVFCAGEHLMFTRKCLIDSLLFGVVKGEGKNRNLLSARTRA